MENNEEKVFEHYLDLPEKARMAVIDGMAPPERCRFTRCSQQSNKEATASKNYIYGISVFCYSVTNVAITIAFGEYGYIYRQSSCGFTLQFIKLDGENYLTYNSEGFHTIWNVQLDDNTNLLQCAVEELKRWVKKYQRTVRSLAFNEESFQVHGETLRNVDFEIERLDNLETLELDGDIEISQVLPKLRRPLKVLRIKGIENGEYLLQNIELAYQVKDLEWFDNNLNKEQFFRLKANTVWIHIDQLTERDIYRFIRSWQEETIGKDIVEYSWCLKDSKFNELKFLRLLRVDEHDPEFVEIKHFIQPGKSAGLLFTRNLQFPYIKFTTRRNVTGRFF